ncbi:MAG: DNA (cytosine-5-)-methyltransferase [Deltaproteobacteria bacterium]|jgi:DNA (cytosine-5)-methyltransferase 1|nr:DNA (cytosine-5-)-methyltransferase [Deltaproteobacteria bacterium]
MTQLSEKQTVSNIGKDKTKILSLDLIFRNELERRGLVTYTSNDNEVFGKPEFTFKARKIAVFCNRESRQGFYRTPNKIDGVNTKLNQEGWTVFQFSENQIINNVPACVYKIEKILRQIPEAPYLTVDLCAGIGGIRRGFERTGHFKNVLSAEIDKYACETYEHLFKENPLNDLTTDSFKQIIAKTPYDILLSGFPCQTFSKVGRGEGFTNEEKGKIFFNLADIINVTRPCAFLFENVANIATRDNGKTFKIILDTLENKLKYKIIGVTKSNKNSLIYDYKDFILNSRNFGIPQNRPRTYIIGFDRERFYPDKLDLLPVKLPTKKEGQLIMTFNDILDKDVEPKYYLSSGLLNTLKKHRKREKNRGNGYGYRVVNDPDVELPIASALLATGGSGRERNLIYDPRKGIVGLQVKEKKSPLNAEGIRVMTPMEWGKLQGFVNYAFVENGVDRFSFPTEISNIQRYKQFGNSVTIPVIEELAQFIFFCLIILRK